MPEETTTEELPPFSFSKKPIKNVFPTPVMPSILHQHSPNKNKPELKPLLNNINYDEQIRAPRMSAATHYTYKPELPRPFTDQISQTSTLSSAELSETDPPLARRVLTETAATTVQSTRYTPATADLSVPTRRNSAPPKSAGLVASALLTYAMPNLDYGTPESPILQEQQKLLRALDNLNNNTTTAEREAHDAPDERGRPARNRGHMNHGPGLQQVYELKKPLCTPAVLRPPEEAVAPESEPLTPILQMHEYPFQLPVAEESEAAPVEPTHEHWKPNNSTDHCMKCFDIFGTFFSPQRKRRHHCRFCGLLFCLSCMYKNREVYYFAAPEEKQAPRTNSGSSTASGFSVMLNVSAASNDDYVSGVMMDARARLVIPIFHNLNGVSVLELHLRFKFCKMCKMCGQNYLRLVGALNLQVMRAGDDISTPYVFIENPYLTAYAAGSLLGLHANVSRSEMPAPERRSSIVNVPSDWTWSSF